MTSDSAAVPQKETSNPVEFGNYLLLEKISEGVITESFRAKVTGTDKFLVIKRLLPRKSGNRELAKAFLEEVKSAALLNHRNISKILNFGQLENSPFMAMEYFPGKDLGQLLEESQEKSLPVSLEQALYILHRICCGLDYAHCLTEPQGKALRITHGDINPQNILITFEGGVKILDFGLSRAANKSTAAKHEMIKAKMGYMSPEEAIGEKTDTRSDVFSTGILLYEMATGKRMYSGDTMQVLARMRKAEFEPPETAAPGLPSRVYELLGKALDKDKERRFQSCGEMLTGIEGCLSEVSSTPTAEGLAEYLKRLFEEGITTAESSSQESGAELSPPPFQETHAPEMKSPAIPLACAPRPQFLRGEHREFPGGKVDLASEPENNLEMMEEISQPPNKNLKGLNSPIRHWVYYSSAIVLFAFIGLGWAFWPQEGKKEKAKREIDVGQAAAHETRHSSRAMEAKTLREKAAALAEKNPREAQNLLLKTIELDPNDVKAHFQLGVAYMNLNNSAKAIEEYQKVTLLDPSFADAFFNLGYLYAAKKDYAKAEVMYSKVVKLSPPYLDEALFNLGVIQERGGKREEGIENLKKALQMNPKNDLARKMIKKLKGDSWGT